MSLKLFSLINKGKKQIKNQDTIVVYVNIWRVLKCKDMNCMYFRSRILLIKKLKLKRDSGQSSSHSATQTHAPVRPSKCIEHAAKQRQKCAAQPARSCLTRDGDHRKHNERPDLELFNKASLPCQEDFFLLPFNICQIEVEYAWFAI